MTSYSAGLRIRAHPSLQSEQIGVVDVNGTIAFIDEVYNRIIKEKIWGGALNFSFFIKRIVDFLCRFIMTMAFG